MSNCLYVQGTSKISIHTSRYARTGHPKTASFDKSNNSRLPFGYEWSITIRDRQKAYHAAHGNGTSQPAYTLGTQGVTAAICEDASLPEALRQFYQNRSEDHDWKTWKIFTDGSLQNGCGGWAVVAEGMRPFGGKVPRDSHDNPITSSTVPELHAIEEACKLLREQRGGITWPLFAQTQHQQ